MLFRRKPSSASPTILPQTMPIQNLRQPSLGRRWGHCLTLHLTARGNDQQTIFHDETDWTDFLTRLRQKVLAQCKVKQ